MRKYRLTGGLSGLAGAGLAAHRQGVRNDRTAGLAESSQLVHPQQCGFPGVPEALIRQIFVRRQPLSSCCGIILNMIASPTLTTHYLAESDPRQDAFLHSPNTSEEEMEEKEDVNQNLHMISNSERCLFPA
jgi:hypothetical protein